MSTIPGIVAQVSEHGGIAVVVTFPIYRWQREQHEVMELWSNRMVCCDGWTVVLTRKQERALAKLLPEHWRAAHRVVVDTSAPAMEEE